MNAPDFRFLTARVHKVVPLPENSRMATVAIDSTEIRPTIRQPPGPSPELPVRTAAAAASPGQGRRNAVVVAAAGAVVLCLVGAAGFAAYPYLPHSLSGLGIGGDGPKPKRSEIRIGKLPDMPEIRNGVPEIVKPVRVIATDSSPQAPAAGKPAEAAGLKPAVAAVAPALAAAPREPTISEILASDLRPASANAPGVPPARQSVLSPNPTRGAPAGGGLLPPAKPNEPVATASILVDTPKTVPAPAALVPLPPVAPVRSAAAVPARPDKPAALSDRPAVAAKPAVLADKPAVAAAKPAGAAKPARTQTAAAAPAPAPTAEPEEERVEILGLKLPNGNDFKRVVGSIGDAVTSLPQKF